MSYEEFLKGLRKRIRPPFLSRVVRAVAKGPDIGEKAGLDLRSHAVRQVYDSCEQIDLQYPENTNRSRLSLIAKKSGVSEVVVRRFFALLVGAKSRDSNPLNEEFFRRLELSATKELAQAVRSALSEAMRLNHEYVDSAHLLFGLRSAKDSLSAEVFELNDIAVSHVQLALEKLHAPGTAICKAAILCLTSDAARVLHAASQFAARRPTGTGHAMLAIAETEAAPAIALLAEVRVQPKRFTQMVRAYLERSDDSAKG